jgi:FAD synthetase
MVRRRKTVLTSGVFDILHPGHLYLLRYASKLKGREGRLVVVIARDETVKKRKGRQPVFPERHRLELVRSLRYVDEAVLGYQPFSFKRIMDRFRPDVIVFGYDQDGLRREFERQAREEGWRVSIVKAPKMPRSKLNSTSEVLGKILRIFSNRSDGLGGVRASALRRSSRS